MLDWKRWSREGERTEYEDRVARSPGHLVGLRWRIVRRTSNPISYCLVPMNRADGEEIDRQYIKKPGQVSRG